MPSSPTSPQNSPARCSEGREAPRPFPSKTSEGSPMCGTTCDECGWMKRVFRRRIAAVNRNGGFYRGRESMGGERQYMCTRRSLRTTSFCFLFCCDVASEILVQGYVRRPNRLTHAIDPLIGRELVAAKGLARQASAHSTQEAGDSFAQPRLVALTLSINHSSFAGAELERYLRPIRIRSFLSRARRPSLLENRTGSNAAETRCGSEEARRSSRNGRPKDRASSS